MNPQECIWEIRHRIIMKTILQDKFIPMPQAMKIPAAKAAVDKEWEKLEKISAWNLTKVRSKSEVIDEAKTSASSTARAVTSYEMIRQRTRSTSSPFLFSSLSRTNFYIRKGRPHGHRYGKKGCKEYHTANQLQRKCKKRRFMSIHDRFIRDARFRKTMLELGRTEEVIREMDKLANEDHTHIATEELSMYIVAIGGSVRILLVPTRCL